MSSCFALGLHGSDGLTRTGPVCNLTATGSQAGCSLQVKKFRDIYVMQKPQFIIHRVTLIAIAIAMFQGLRWMMSHAC
jgi:hypothetical protein